MRSLVIFVSLISWAVAQNGRGPQHQDHNGHGWDIRLAVPGEPGDDYPTLGAIPRTSFSCAGREPGYYADLQTGCQVFRVCTVGSTYGFQSFLCPNGTLFNQAVFVCDWWMNVNCENSEQLYTNEKFENLRLGPQLMKDIKKMLTHPMRNSYDRTAMKSDQIVMQEYKPPVGQLFPNGALLAGPDRTPNNIYVPAKQIQQNSLLNIYSTISTPDSKYIPAVSNTNQFSSQRDIEVFQRQRQNDQRMQYDRIQSTPQTENTISNGHAVQFAENTNLVNNNEKGRSPHPTSYSNQRNAQITQSQLNNAESIKTANTQNLQRGQFNHQRHQYTNNMKSSQLNREKQNAFRDTMQQYNYKSNQEKQPYTYKPPTPQFINELVGDVGNELKQNLVSTNAVPSTVVTKTITYSRIIQDPKPGKPKSRITVKTWIVKPSKAANLVASPTPYTHNRPTLSQRQNIVQETTPYAYKQPPTEVETEKIISVQEPELYVKNQPTQASKLVATTNSDAARLYLAPTPTSSLRPTLSGRLYSISTSPPTTKASPAYFAPTTFKPAARLYLPPSDSPEILSQQYLSPNTIQQPVYHQSEQLRATPTFPSPTFVTNTNKPSLSLSTQPYNNNLTFSDLLTKEKLDFTVNDIVKDTGKVLKTAAPPQYGQYNENIKFVDHLENNYLPAESDVESGENLTSESPTVVSKSAKLIAKPALNLEPPIESYNDQNTNPLSKLPFFKEPALSTNTIERTVSLKITIPEKLAKYLFKSRNQNNFDKLEILNAENSNYLLLSNTLLNQNAKNTGNFIPLSKLVENNNSNISTSQALVFSFLADSINAANEYSNIAKQDALSATPASQQFQNLNNEDLTHITNKISQLTSSQYTRNDNTNFGEPNIASIPQTTNGNYQENQFRGNTKYTSNQQNQAQLIKVAQYNIPAPSQQSQNQGYPTRYQSGNNENILNINNQNQIYSGQLYQYPVPVVTSQIYNRPQPQLVSQSNTQTTFQQATGQNAANNNNLMKQSSGELEIVQSQTLPLNPAKLQLEPTNEPESPYSQESLTNLLNSDNGISAQLQDKIVGTIPHPLEDDKLLTYEKDQSYYLYTKLEENRPNIGSNDRTQVSNYGNRLNAKFTPNRNIPNVITFQFVPSEIYQLDDNRDQQNINALETDDFSVPRNIAKENLLQNNNQKKTVASNVNYSVKYSTSAKQVAGQYNPINDLYNGPSSYSAPQSSVGSLEFKQKPVSYNSRLEQFSEKQNNIGYPKETPARRFNY